MQLSLEELNKILKTLQITTFKDSAKSWIASTIARNFENANDFRTVIMHIGEDTTNDLLLYVHTRKPLSEYQKTMLSEVGIIINGEIPIDFKERLQKWSRLNFVKTFPSNREDVYHSFFLKTLLVVLYFEKVRKTKLTRRKNDRNVRKLSEELFMDKATLWDIINTLVQLGLLHKIRERYELNIHTYKKWSKEPIDAILENLYSFKAGDRVMTFLQRIAQYQLKPNEWVDMSVLSDTSLEYDSSKQYGLIQVYKTQVKTFVQLTPESWYLTKKEYHPLWNQKALLVTADFEVFVPYHYEPFVLFELLPVCFIKDIHYFLVLQIDFDRYNKNNKGFSDFYHTLIAKSINIPDVVMFDLTKSTK